MKLRRALPADAASCAALECLQPAAAGWGRAGFETELSQSCAVIWTAWDGAELMGFLALRCAADCAEILNVAVHPARVRSGVGTALLQQALQQLQAQGVRRVSLEVAQDNAPALALYTRAGLAKWGVRKDFYGPGRSAWILGKEL